MNDEFEDYLEAECRKFKSGNGALKSFVFASLSKDHLAKYRALKKKKVK